MSALFLVRKQVQKESLTISEEFITVFHSPQETMGVCVCVYIYVCVYVCTRVRVCVYNNFIQKVWPFYLFTFNFCFTTGTVCSFFHIFKLFCLEARI